MTQAAPEWWRRPGLESRDGRLTIGGEDAEALARLHGTPLFAYDRRRYAENARRLQDAAAGAGIQFRLRFALKANPLPEVLEVFRARLARFAGCRGDRCLLAGRGVRALECGWRADETSDTGTNVSERDMDVLLAHNIHVNLDAISQIRRYGRRAPSRGRSACGSTRGPVLAYRAHLEYSGLPTKFGIGLDRLADALNVDVGEHDLTIDTVHFHAGSGWLGDGLGAFEAALVRAVEVTERLIAARCPITQVTWAAGSACRRATMSQPWTWTSGQRCWRATSGRSGWPSGRNRRLPVEGRCDPAREVVTVEERGRVAFVGLDLGWNVNCAYFIYRYLQEILPVAAVDAPRTEVVTVAGHINEASDVFAEDYPMAPVAEGDIVALLNAGGYHQAISSTHCLRPMGDAIFLDR